MREVRPVPHLVNMRLKSLSSSTSISGEIRRCQRQCLPLFQMDRGLCSERSDTIVLRGNSTESVVRHARGYIAALWPRGAGFDVGALR